MAILKYLWQFPQHLLGILVIVFTGAESIQTYKNAKVYYTNSNFGVSLGKYIIVPAWAADYTIEHEYGHSIQSIYLGPLYLIVVGIPSLTMNIMTRLRILRAEHYYKHWPECWADKLGNVKRT